jgi:hypothetical protein
MDRRRKKMEKEGVLKGHNQEEKKEIVVVRANAVEVVPKGPTNVEKVEKFLKDNPHKYCDDCLSAILKIYPRQQVNQICRENLRGVIRRREGECFRCEKYKLVNRYEVRKI